MKAFLALGVQFAFAAGITFSVARAPEPRFGWLFFGPEARLRVLVRLEGEAITLTYYLDGKPTGRKDHFKEPNSCKDVKIADPDGKTSYLITSLYNLAQKEAPPEIMADVQVSGPVSYTQYCDIPKLTAKSEGAPLAHFHGPLTIGLRTINWKVPSGLKLPHGDKPGDLFACIGTMDADKGCWVVVRTHDNKNQSLFSEENCPSVKVEFPPKKKGDPPIVRSYKLPQVC